MGTKTASTSWTCRGCGEQNDPLDRVCSKCGGDGRAAIAGAFTNERLLEEGIPVTQAAAAAKEAAVDETERRIEVALSKSTGFEAEIVVRGSRDRWAVGWNFQSKTSGRINPVATAAREFACEEGAAASGFEALRLWLQGQPESPKRRKALAETGIHEARAIGPWLKQYNKEFTQPRPSLQKAAAAAPSASKPAVPLAERVNGASVEQLELARIQPSPENRKDFDPTELQELADSIKSHGLGQPVMVCRLHADPATGGKTWELIAGERRYRASQLAGLGSIPARVIDCTPAEARELRLIENLKRKDLNAIEEARGYQQLLHENGYTQKALGDRIGVDQSTIANRIRLLRLPAALQDLIIRREIPESHGRQLVTYAEIPNVLDHFAKAIKEQIRDEGLPSLRDWPGWLHSTAQEVLRDVEPGEYFSYIEKGQRFSGYVLFTEKQLEKWKDELQIVVLKNPYQKRNERFAANVKRWEELHGELVKAKAEREAKAAGTSGPKAKEGDARTPAEIARRTEQLAEQYKTRIRRYRNRWIQRTAALRTETMTDDKLVRLLIGFAGMEDRRGRRGQELVEIVKSFGGKAVGDGRTSYGGFNRELLSIMTVQGKDLLDIGRAAVKQWIQHDVEEYDTALRAADLPAFVELFEIDLAAEWRVDDEFLRIHSKAQIADLCKEWKLSGPWPEKRDQLIAALLEKDQAKRIPAPKVLLKEGK